MAQDKSVKRITVTYTDGTSRDMEVGFAAESDAEGNITVDFMGLQPGQFESLMFKMANILVQQYYRRATEEQAAQNAPVELVEE